MIAWHPEIADDARRKVWQARQQLGRALNELDELSPESNQEKVQFIYDSLVKAEKLITEAQRLTDDLSAP